MMGYVRHTAHTGEVRYANEIPQREEATYEVNIRIKLILERLGVKL
jgi:hypothetical protein